MSDNINGSRALGLDFGWSKVGIAVGNSRTGTSQRLTIIAAKRGVPVWSELDLVIKQWQPVVLVVGLPLNMDGTQSTLSQQAQAFAQMLSERYNIAHVMVDERLSSFAARGQLQESHGRAFRKQRSPVSNEPYDDLAAALILESWFSTLKPSQQLPLG